MSSPLMVPGLEAYRANWATVSFAPEDYAAMQGIVFRELASLRALAGFVAQATTFLEAMQAVDNDVTDTLITKTYVGNSESMDFHAISRSAVAASMAAATSRLDNHGVHEIRPYNLGRNYTFDYKPSNEINADIALPYGWPVAGRSLSVDAIETPGNNRAVISGLTEYKRSRRWSRHVFASIIDFTKPVQRAQTYFGGDHDEDTNVIQDVTEYLRTESAEAQFTA